MLLMGAAIVILPGCFCGIGVISLLRNGYYDRRNHHENSGVKRYYRAGGSAELLAASGDVRLPGGRADGDGDVASRASRGRSVVEADKIAIDAIEPL
jgi:hypothetical protein